ncbi:MAG: acyl-CoA/acyl-ACP dehydrogenase [Planctomycetes bacterium]|nr:acyl-CoA/acyl-ACP dehydrogenase [Planctomycetota bacterium]
MNESLKQILAPDDPALDALCERLRGAADALDTSGAWPAQQLAWLGEAGVYRWFLPEEYGGCGWSEADVIRGYLRLSAACLTTTFIVTQRTGACRRIADCENDASKSRWLPPLLTDEAFATVGISHLTTSRRYLQRPVLRAAARGTGYLLDGYSPWVTGADAADCVVIGAMLDDGRQLLVALPTDAPGVSTEAPAQLVALSASHTGPLRLNNVEVPAEWILAGPIENVMSRGSGSTGGLQTSTLALGLSRAATEYMLTEAERGRTELRAPAESLAAECEQTIADVLAVAEGQPACSSEDLRGRANSIALRSTQAALAAAKGAGYVVGHPTGRWCREALFFLVWSCPQPVLNATLCELAGLE